jgi:hypothetical protein
MNIELKIKNLSKRVSQLSWEEKCKAERSFDGWVSKKNPLIIDNMKITAIEVGNYGVVGHYQKGKKWFTHLFN